MNFRLYIFGNPNGYDQYPLDDTGELFKHLAQNRQSNSQLSVYRSGQLAYYAYIRNLADGYYLGICIVFNSVYCRDIQSFFNIFSGIIFEIAKQGKILKFNKKGAMAFAVQKFCRNETEIKRLRTVIQEKIDAYTCLISFGNSFKLENNAFKTVFLKDDTYIQTEGNFRFSEPKTPEKKKKRIIAFVFIIIALAVGMLCYSIFGKMRNGKVENMKIVLTNGTTYQYWGEIKDGLPTGKGKARYNDRTYEGYFENGLRHGYGEMILPNQTTYKGYYAGDNAEGEGKIFDLDGKLYFEGTWKNNKRHGVGTTYDEHGNASVDEWENDICIKK